MIFGLLCIDKPSGPTSHDIVAKIRRGSGERRVGHAGTLDPLATGVLVVALGPATRLIEYLRLGKKSYRVAITLGVETATYDAEGEIIAQNPVPNELGMEHIDNVLDRFRGPIMQIPPAYSAIKVAGKAAYARTRAGESFVLEARPTEIFRIDIVSYSTPTLVLEIECSPGTYIRSLAHDLGQVLGPGGMLSGLRRTVSGDFTQETAVNWERLQAEFSDGSWVQYLLPPDLALQGTPKVDLDQEQVRRISNGMPIAGTILSKGLGRAYTPDGLLCAVLESDRDNHQWRPIKVFSEVIQTWMEKR